jgi:hypothetical protein
VWLSQPQRMAPGRLGGDVTAPQNAATNRNGLAAVLSALHLSQIMSAMPSTHADEHINETHPVGWCTMCKKVHQSRDTSLRHKKGIMAPGLAARAIASGPLDPADV